MAKKSSRAAQKADITAAQERLAQLKTEQQRREARGKTALWTVLIIVLAGVIASLAYLVLTHKTKADVTEAAITPVADTSGILGVKAWQYHLNSQTAQPGDIEHNHVTGTVAYKTSPPVGGPHDAQWLNCGAYDKTPRIENAVHDMEHGAVWITYRPDLPATQIKALRDLFATVTNATLTDKGQQVDSKSKYLDLFPYSPQSSPIVVTSWGHQLDVTSPTDPRIGQFVATFRASQTFSPEYGGTCSGGVGTPTST